jgi:CelD/BcsL family acetyltransferase involved in cellulose biosynthesis
MNQNWNMEIIDSRDKLAKLEPLWNELLHRSVSDNPFLTFEWITSWLEIFSDEKSLYIIIACLDSQPKAIAPLILHKDGLLTFVGYPQNDYADFIIDRNHPEALSKIFDYIYSLNSFWKKIILDQIKDSDSHLDLFSQYLKSNKKAFRIVRSDTCPAMVLDDREVSRKMYYKRNIASYINWFRKEGDFRYVVYAEPGEAIARLDDLFAMHISRWDGTATPSYFRETAMKEFYRKFVTRMTPRGWVQFSGLTLNNKFLALYICLEYNKILYLYKTCFNLNYAKKSPGQVVLRYLFDYAIEHNINELDFARGDEGYKDRFANKMRQNHKIIIYRLRWKKELAELFYKFRYSRTVDILYRNKAVQKVKYRFMAILRERA